ncbi:MAG: hypothetical protein ACE5HF_09850 [Gemmatimonadota bacterium]
MTARREGREKDRAASSLVDWLLGRGLLRGPFLFVDYWGNVLRLRGAVPDAQIRSGLVDPTLFRAGLDRPDLEIPRLRTYLLLFLAGPVLLPFRFFRRIGRYRTRFRREVGEEVLEALEPFRLELSPAGDGRVDVSGAGVRLAEGVLDPRLISGFSSLFYAAYKLPLAATSAILLVALLAPALDAAGLLDTFANHLVLAGFPALTVLLWIVYRDWVTAILGALPVLIGASLVRILRVQATQDWTPLFLALGGLFVLYLFIDWFFMPRPVPPVLMLYRADGPGHPYRRDGDVPYWLEGRAYWVWRYLMLSPAEINKFWERDWERVELWIRADGPGAGGLEWVVTDGHYRELWIPYESLAAGPSLDRCAEEARRLAREGEPGTWLLEVDADRIFHTPYFRAVSFLPEEGSVPVRRVWHVVRGLWRRARDRDVDGLMRTLERMEIHEGVDVLEDVPEVFAKAAARHLLAQPWRYWRYPLGATRRRERRAYEPDVPEEPPLAADPALQIKGEGS